MSVSATALTSWARAIHRTLGAVGVDADALFATAGLDPAALADPNARYPVALTARLWRLAVDATDNPALGLDVARQVTPTTFHALGYAQVASATLGEAFDRAIRYFRIVSDAGELDFARRGETYEFTMRVVAGADAPAPESIDAFMSVFARMVRGLAGREHDPQRVDLARPAPADAAPWQRVFRMMPTFDAPVSRLVFDAALIERPLDGANPELAQHNDQIVIAHLARMERGTFADRVRSRIVEAMPQGAPGAGDIAAVLHLSPRNLQRKLAAEGTSFRALLESTRADLAKAYLARGDSIDEITFLLAFSDASAFSRAFKRWTGVSPSAYREAPPD